jgi:hypothetical protein
MKKILRKLVIRRETIRALNNIDLMRVKGGGDPAGMDRTQSGINCPAQDAVPMPVATVDRSTP